MPAKNEKGFHALAVVLIISLFALWGAGHRLYDTLVPQFAKVFDLNETELVLTYSVYSIIYFLFAIPAALYARILGYRAAIIFGLGSLAVGGFLFYPAAGQHAYGFFMFAAVVMSTGWIFIEVSANPLIMRLGPVETCVQRLNFAQAFYPVGVLIGLYVGRWIILSDLSLPISQLAHAIVRPYITIGAAVLLLAFLIDKAHFPAIATERVKRGAGAGQEYRTLLRRPLFMFGVVAQAFYIAAQGGTWTLITQYVHNALPGIGAPAAADALMWSLILYGIGRFVGTALMSRIDPDRLLAVFAGCGLLLGAVATGAGGYIGVICLVGTSLFMSIMFPTIFADAVRDLGPLTKAGSSLVYVGGAGCGLALMLIHWLWGFSSAQYAMLVPTLSYAVVLSYAIANYRERHPVAVQGKACAT